MALFQDNVRAEGGGVRAADSAEGRGDTDGCFGLDRQGSAQGLPRGGEVRIALLPEYGRQIQPRRVQEQLLVRLQGMARVRCRLVCGGGPMALEPYRPWKDGRVFRDTVRADAAARPVASAHCACRDGWRRQCGRERHCGDTFALHEAQRRACLRVHVWRKEKGEPRADRDPHEGESGRVVHPYRLQVQCREGTRIPGQGVPRPRTHGSARGVRFQYRGGDISASPQEPLPGRSRGASRTMPGIGEEARVHASGSFRQEGLRIPLPAQPCHLADDRQVSARRMAG